MSCRILEKYILTSMNNKVHLIMYAGTGFEIIPVIPVINANIKILKKLT